MASGEVGVGGVRAFPPAVAAVAEAATSRGVLPCRRPRWWQHVCAVDGNDDGGSASHQWWQRRKMQAGCK
jgi:hypothetical protein